MYKQYIKPAFDFFAALLLLILFSPVMLVIALMLYLLQDGKVLFRQQRPGYHGNVFMLLKFKTMNDSRDETGQLLPDMMRIHPFGNFLRKTSLDELPQLINVLKGEMSFVGPRPLLTEYLPLYNDEQSKRHDVKPGITGWAQVNGRNAISWKEKFEYDVYYVNHISLSLDVKILLMTVKKVFTASGVNEAENTTMTKFTGEE